jgi:hypothetical protein
MSWREGLPASCWTTEQAQRALPTEAETPSDGIFLATHAPLPIYQLANAMADEGTLVAEEDVLAAVLAPGDLPIVPILGPSGSGKSHLVRWLRHRLEAERPDDLVVVFVPKLSMSLEGIALEIIRAGDGPEFDALAAEVRGATQELTEQMAVLSLRSALANLVQTKGAAARPDEDADTTSFRNFLAEHLPNLLNDAVAGPPLFREGAAIHRLAMENLHGRKGEDKERAFAFEAHDLEISLADIGQAGASAQLILAQLAANPALRGLAATMLNEQLEPAISSVFGIKGATITDIFLRLRRHFHGRGQRLLLLIEDFTIFQGIQGAVLDAITVIPREKDALCSLRTVMAVTTGYFRESLPDTVRTRTHRVFDLTPQDDDEASSIGRFVAGYLNAARLNGEALDGFKGGVAPPNACDRCPVRETCHDAFGEVDGVGLFPLTAHLVDQTSRNIGAGFIARTYLNQVLKPLLVNEAASIDRAEFPTERFANAHRRINATLVTADVRLRSANPDDAQNDERRARTVQLYTAIAGERPAWPTETVYRAFGMAAPAHPLPADVEPPVALDQDAPPFGEDRPTASKPSKASDSTRALTTSVENWGSTGQITQSDRVNVLDLVLGAVIPRLGLIEGMGGPVAWRPDSDIQPTLTREFFALADTAPAQQPGRVVVPRDDRMVRALSLLAQFRAHGSWQAVGGGEARRFAEIEIDKIIKSAHELIVRRNEMEDALPHVAAALRASAWVFAPTQALDAKEPDLVKLMLTPPALDESATPDAKRLEVGAKGGRHRNVVMQTLRTVGYSQGDTEPAVIDAVMLLDALRQAPTLPDVAEFQKPMDDYVRLLNTVLGTKQLQERISRLRTIIPDVSVVGDDVDALIRDLSQALTILKQAGKLGAAAVNLSDLPTRLKDPASKFERIRRFSDAVAAVEPSDTLSALRALGDGDVTFEASVVGTWISDCETVLGAIEKLDTDGASSGSPLARALAKLETALAGLVEAPEEER